MNSGARARLQVLTAAALFSTGGAAIKAAPFTSFQVASLRSLVAAVALWLLVPEARRLRGSWTNTAFVAAAYAATVILFVLSNKLTTSANAIFLQSAAPLFIVLLGPWLLAERIQARDLGFLSVMGLGMALFFLDQGVTYRTAPDPVTGNIIAAASAVTYALMLIGLRSLGLRGGSPAAAVVLGNVVAFLVALPMALPFGPAPISGWAIILFLGVCQIGLAYAVLARAVSQVPAFEMSLLLLAEPALNPIFSWLIHGERPGPWSLLGGTLLLGTTGIKAWVDAQRAARSARVSAVAPD
jgi:drug/metabolite transporter, DME family